LVLSSLIQVHVAELKSSLNDDIGVGVGVGVGVGTAVPSSLMKSIGQIMIARFKLDVVF
jgi:hypothetical protein